MSTDVDLELAKEPDEHEQLHALGTYTLRIEWNRDTDRFGFDWNGEDGAHTYGRELSLAEVIPAIASELTSDNGPGF